MKYKNIYIAVFIITGFLVLNRCYWLVKSLSMHIALFDSFQSIIQHLTTLIALAGLIIFGATKFKRPELLCLYFSMVIIVSPLNVLYYKTAFSATQFYHPDSWTWFSLGVDAISLITASVGLWVITRQKQLKLHYIFIGQEAIAEFAPASRWKRFFNYLTDSLLIIYAVYLYISIMGIISAFSEDPYEFRRSIARSQLIPLFFYFFYYLVFEGIFKTTPGKSLTNTIIVNAEGKRPGFGQMIGRTFCRFIPFDGLSFFKSDRHGWHDSVTGTYVVDASMPSDQPDPLPAPEDLL